jgi:hypothetical protein
MCKLKYIVSFIIKGQIDIFHDKYIFGDIIRGSQKSQILIQHQTLAFAGHFDVKGLI